MGEFVCLKPGCDRTWPHDPVLDVPCPDCKVGVGVKCRRPSGHGAFGGAFHAARDIAADKAGAYGPCPLNLCGLARKAGGADVTTGQMALLGDGR